MANITNEELSDEFELFSITITDDNIFHQLKEYCEKYRMGAEGIVEHWLAYSLKKNLKLTRDTLEAFEREQLVKQARSNLSKTPTSIKKADDRSSKRNCSTILTAYDEMAISKKRYLSPDNQKSKKANNTTSPVMTTDSPCFIPSQQFLERTNVGEVLMKFGPDIERNLNINVNTNVKICLFDKKQNIENMKYMCQKMSRIVKVTREHILHMEQIITKNISNFDENSYFGCTIHESGHICGRIITLEDQKLRMNNIFIQSPLSTQLVSLDVTNANNFSLFSGQIVCAEGTNPTGKIFYANKIYEGIPISVKKKKLNSSLSILVASGPYTTSDNLLFEPLNELINRMKMEKPDIGILCGPFVDVKLTENKKFRNVDWLEEFNLLMRRLDEVAQSLGIKLIILPSQRDFIHHFVFPQFSLKLPYDMDNVYSATNPSTLLINDEVVIGMTSTDILMHLSANTISSQTHDVERISRLIQLLLYQRSYYPLSPHPSGVNLDVELFEIAGKMPTIPHILIIPSDLKYFCKEVNGVLCINPGRLAKGKSGGSYASVQLQNNIMNASIIRV